MNTRYLIREQSERGPAWLVETDAEHLSRHETQAEAEQARAAHQRLTSEPVYVRYVAGRERSWVLWTYFLMPGYGLDSEAGTGTPYRSLAAAKAALAEAQRQTPALVLDQNDMYGSEFDALVLRQAEHNRSRWTVACGVGSHTEHVRGSYATETEALAAGDARRRALWEARLQSWRDLCRQNGLPEPTLAASLPEAYVYYPARGVSAWDAKPAQSLAQALAAAAPMTAADVRALRESLPAPARPDSRPGKRSSYPSRPEFAAMLGVSAETVRSWEMGRNPIPTPLATLMRQLQRVAP